MRTVYYLLLSIMLLSACREQETLQHEQDVQVIRDYLSQQGIVATENSDANFFYRFLTTTGDSLYPIANIGLNLVMNYNCKLLDGTTIYSSPTIPDTIVLDETIYGWQLALPMMSIGDRMQLWLPSRLAYGPNGSGIIPPNAVLEFDIELIEIYPHF